jgi:hypothetical protein
MQVRRLGLIAASAALACATYQGAPGGTGAETMLVSTGGVGEASLRTGMETVASRSLDLPPEQAWAVLPAVYEELDVPLTVYDTVDMRIGNTGFRPRRVGGERLSRYLDCGRGVTATANADRYEVNVSLTTRLTEADAGGTLLWTEIRASAKPRDVSGHPVRCSSKGTLETRIAEAVEERVRP